MTKHQTQLAVDSLSFVYQGKGALEVRLKSLKLEAGQSAALCGLSGSGKSTLLECLGLIRPGFKAKEYKLAGFDLLNASLKEQRALRAALLGIMPQQGSLIPFLKIEDDFLLTIKLARDAKKCLALGASVSLEQSLMQAHDLALKLGIGKLLGRFPQTLSQGQRQRAAFIKALLHSPKLLLIDEPTAALDPLHARELFEIMLQECRERQICAVAVTHDLKLVNELKLKTCVYNPSSSTEAINIFG